MSATIDEVSRSINFCFFSPQRLNALFLSKVMDDGETIRGMVHSFGKIADDAMRLLIEYYETKNKEQLLDRMEELEDSGDMGMFFGVRREEEKRPEGSVTSRELESMYVMATKSKEEPETFWKDALWHQKAAIFNEYYGHLFKFDQEKQVYYVDEKVQVELYENKQSNTLYDATFRESNWLDLARYDEPHTLEVKDYFSAPFLQRKYVNATVIDILRKTVEREKMAVYEKNFTDGSQLSKVCAEIYAEDKLSAPKFVKTLTLLNKGLSSALKGEGQLREEHAQAAAMLIDKSPEYFAGIDYATQLGFYKTDAYKELLKFSFMTTFTKRKSFNEQAMNNYVGAVANSGHWMRAQNLVTRMIMKNTNNWGGINRGIMELNLIKPRPNKVHRSENHYYDRDLERMEYAKLYLAKSVIKPSKLPCSDISHERER